MQNMLDQRVHGLGAREPGPNDVLTKAVLEAFKPPSTDKVTGW